MRKFESKLHATGNNTGIIVPPEVLESLTGRRPAVKVVINGYEYSPRKRQKLTKTVSGLESGA